MIICQVDSFTKEPFKGNPAGVVIMSEAKSDLWMQNMAKEMNLSETAFLYKQECGFFLRWFTPRLEVDLCGHATLASAHILWEMGYLNRKETACFNTLSGELKACYREGWIDLDFPLKEVEAAELPGGIKNALGLSISASAISRDKWDKYVVELESEEALKNYKPDFGRLSKVLESGLIITAKSKEYDFVSRFFAPSAGIDEDPVTGSAHCILGPYWGRKLEKLEMTAFQASERGGVLKVRLDSDRVIISGQAVTVFRGELLS